MKNDEMKQFAIWQRTLAPQSDDLDPQRALLNQAFLNFRNQIRQLIGEIGGLLPNLTVHDITHIDALWRVADQIAGPTYPLNPAEAFVLGGAFLLHDAAHVLAAYKGGLQEIKATINWKDLISQRFEGQEPPANSPEERFALFSILRDLHATQAHKLLKIEWKIPTSGDAQFLLPDFPLREFYGDLIGDIAASHHWPVEQVVEHFRSRILTAPASLAPATWQVDALKIAFILRTADAAHIDADRAPWFLFALRQPQGISELHWRFQSKMGQPSTTADGELRLSSGSPFLLNERKAWWLAYDTAKMIDRELRDAFIMLRENGRLPLAACGVRHVGNPAAFALDVPTSGWEPVHVEPVIRDVSKVIGNFGGAKLYGDYPELALRELIQNAVDAINASRGLGNLECSEGKIEVALDIEDGAYILHVTDNGIGMSKRVLTDVLPDFGNSLWTSELLRSELPGLASAEFKPIGQFGIGFFSVFMLGENVKVTTKRFRKSAEDSSDQWTLEFESGLISRPTLRKPSQSEELLRAGTRVSIKITENILKKIAVINSDKWKIAGLPVVVETSLMEQTGSNNPVVEIDFGMAIANLCPTSQVYVSSRVGNSQSQVIVAPNDWVTISADELFKRISLRESFYLRDNSKTPLIELLEPTGRIVGRIKYSKEYWGQACTTHNGIRNGVVRGVVGILIGTNNMDLARTKGTPIASAEAWKNWALRSIETVKEPSIRMLAALHPLCREKDLPMYELGGEFLTEEALRKWLQDHSEIKTYAGRPTYEDSDDMSETKFNDYFDPAKDILYFPKNSSPLCKELNIAEILYSDRFEKILKDVWGDFEEFETDADEIVGEVEGVDILRSIFIYSKTITADML